MNDLFLHWEDPASRAPRCRIVTDGLRIGSSEGLADIRITATGMNAVHAELRVRPDGTCEVVGMGSSRIVSNGESTPRCVVTEGSAIHLGALEVRFESSASLAPRAGKGVGTNSGRPLAAAGRPAPAGDTRRSGVLVGAVSATVVLAVAVASLYFLRRPEPSPTATKPAPAKPSAHPMAAPAGAARAGARSPANAQEKDLFSQARKSVVTVIAKHSFEKGFATGTGFFVDAQGRVVTNYHVVKQTDYQQILLPGSKQPVDARIISKDQESDLVLLQAYVTPPVPVAPMIPVSSELKMGDTVYALGSPAGPELAVSLSRGIVSSDRPRTFGDKSFIQHDAAVNPGNSGGPLLNGRGEVVGINTAKVKGTEGISFAIPIEDVRRFIEVAR